MPDSMTRVVSLVPSATETLLDLGVTPVACTRFCEQPTIPTIGGTKDPNVASIVALDPDVVVVNDEENRREDADALVAAGLEVFSMSPRSVGDVGPAIAALAERVGVGIPNGSLPVPHAARGAAVALIWRRPWMTQARDTYGSSVLEYLGWTNPISGPVMGPMLSDASRYPEIELDELRAWAPDVIALPNEPYPFGPRHVDELARAVPSARIRLLDGRDLFWWGTRTPSALTRLGSALE